MFYNNKGNKISIFWHTFPDKKDERGSKEIPTYYRDIFYVLGILSFDGSCGMVVIDSKDYNFTGACFYLVSSS